LLKSFLLKDSIEVGCDEAGRGCLAGPVVAAAVILPPTFQHSLLNDSKFYFWVSESEFGLLLKSRNKSKKLITIRSNESYLLLFKKISTLRDFTH